MSRTLGRPANPTAAQRIQWYGISRIDQPTTRTHGWFVRIQLQKQRDGSYSPRHTKFFGDVSNGGPRGALREARKWRDRHVKSPSRRRAKAKR